jgi:hypothetical protein
MTIEEKEKTLGPRS